MMIVKMDCWYYLSVLLLVHVDISSQQQPHTNLPVVDRRIYELINGTASCIRLTNATHQIGCSSSYSGQRGFIDYVSSDCNFDRVLTNGPIPPYIVLLEPHCFVPENLHLLRSSSRVVGMVVRERNGTTSKDNFSPERSCPNDGFGVGGECSRPWNTYSSDLLFEDLGDFPVLTVPSDQFQVMLECYERHNANATTGSVDEYPFCYAELTADMYVSMNTPTCKRRETLPINYLGGISFCRNMGDFNVWGTPFRLTNSTRDIIMLAAKMDSVSFTLTNYSIGAQSEVAGIVTLLAIIEQIGRLKQSNVLIRTESPIMYSFFNGESWDYIGSSRMVYDMINDKFPYEANEDKIQLPLIGLSNITTFLELSQLGFQAAELKHLFLHGAVDNTSIVTNLSDELRQEGFNLSLATRADLPPASLQRFLRANMSSDNFEGYVLADFNEGYNNKFFGSQYDDLNNLIGNSSLDSVAEKLAQIATAVTKTVLATAGATCTTGNCSDSVNITSDFVSNLLDCFLVNSSCSLFTSVTNTPYNNSLASGVPLNRYVSVVPLTEDPILSKTYTSVIFQLIAKYTAFNNTVLTCDQCWNMVDGNDQVTNRTALPINNTHCHCLESYTYMHRAESPALINGQPDSTEYSTWAESHWNAIQIRIYLVAHSTTEIGALVGGLLMTLITLLVAIQCSRRADKLFKKLPCYDLYHVS